MNSVWMIAGMLGIFALWMLEVDARWLWAFGLALLAWSFNTVVNARNQLETALATVDLFERTPESLDEAEHAMRAWIADLEFATRVIEELDLNTRIWSKAGATM